MVGSLIFSMVPHFPSNTQLGVGTQEHPKPLLALGFPSHVQHVPSGILPAKSPIDRRCSGIFFDLVGGIPIPMRNIEVNSWRLKSHVPNHQPVHFPTDFPIFLLGKL